MSQSENVITVKKNGPLMCKGDITVLSADGEILLQDKEAWLCRCGASRKMPFCDGSHKRTAFIDEGKVNDSRSETLNGETGSLVITVKPSAMLSFKGPVTLQNEDGSTSSQRKRGALCRCGASVNKPFCDVSHKQTGFCAD
ncbi:MAG: CDGSH iron-sulfur domain-containing protein [Gammaproteobacteria bacterium]|nr:CDGSH iron-sulfur domain-containing protein [Gammaproteobacteria bacterium]